MAAVASRDEERSSRALGSGADPNFRDMDDQEFTPLLMAVKSGSVELVRLLLRAGADPARGEASKMTPLMSAAKMGSEELVEALLPLSDARARSGAGMTALLFGVLGGSARCVEMLLPFSDIDSSSPVGSARFLAGRFDRPDLAEFVEGEAARREAREIGEAAARPELTSSSRPKAL